MKSNPNFTIVYVFGPEICKDKYFKDEKVSREAGEWVKIGETGYHGNIESITTEIMKKEAISRIRQETRTGLPITSLLYDVFIFPYKSHTDDIIREKLCNEIYEIENSKQINKDLEEDKIPAGREFVYGVRRSNIKYAVQSYDHDLIAEAYAKKLDNDADIAKIDAQILSLAKICHCNNVIINKDEDSKDEKTALLNRKPTLNLGEILKVGEEVVLTRDGKRDIVMDENNDPITAKYIGDNRFECRGEIGRSSGFAKKYLNDYGGKNLSTVNGNEYWTYNGQKLTSLRKN